MDWQDNAPPSDGERGDGGRHRQAHGHAGPNRGPLDRIDRFERAATVDRIDEKFGYLRQADRERVGWLVNMHPTVVRVPGRSGGCSGVDLYFIEEDGQTFKSTFLYEPYFFVVCKPGTTAAVEEHLRREFGASLAGLAVEEKEDLSLANHLVGQRQTILRLSFREVSDLMAVRRAIAPAVRRNRSVQETGSAYAAVMAMVQASTTTAAGSDDEIDELDGRPVGRRGGAATSARARRAASRSALENIVDLREFDVPYYVRTAIDNGIHVGLWYAVSPRLDGSGSVQLSQVTGKVARAEPTVFAFDIETTKLPLKFPDAATDAIMMISYMIDGQGYLITNREIVSADIGDFEYTPKPEFEGPFAVFNERDELALLRRFFEHIQDCRPAIYVTFNGDFFDWPYIETRARAHGLDMFQEIGVAADEQGEYKATYACHMDCLRWVKRDSYLPAGSHGLKAVTTAKLGYNPMELDPEDMTPFAAERPQTLAQYSVSDAVATYYLYMKYVNPFIFSLCNIIPMNPDEVLRKGSGTLCETLLMVQATKAHVLYPNKHTDRTLRFFEGHLLEAETYVGGHVEALQAGVFRYDLPVQFRLDAAAFGELAESVDAALRFSLAVEHSVALEDVENYNEVRQAIIEALERLRDRPSRSECPLVYHLDVAAMYPNIILTNRLQPDAVVDESVCASCAFNSGAEEPQCQRRMTWDWRGEFYPLQRNEFDMLKRQLERETFPPAATGDADKPREFDDLPADEQAALLKKRVTDYSRKVHNRLHDSRVVRKESVVCQRENAFYIDTVRLFRDRRYEYKGLLKRWKGRLEAAATPADVDEARKMTVLYDSLQLAHKCILNSFYGYVMRKGSRWYSMEMAAIVCLTGATIIQMVRALVDRIGQPLELDTDGIWCILPASFPENFHFKLRSGKRVAISYPCVMLNHMVHQQFTNEQYHELLPSGEYARRSENSIFFEVDGPYRAMVLPASTEEDKLLKKRYAVFHADGSLAELKGFEVKRRGELKLIKSFQSELFHVFLAGGSLTECYAAVGAVANRWLDVLFSRGRDLSDRDLFELISENRSMSKSLKEYGAQKSTALCTARRLAEFLGPDMVKNRGLACQFVITLKPLGQPVSERAVPVAIFQAPPDVQKQFLRRWLRDSGLTDFDLRSLLDWGYYIERFGSVIQKLITIPAAMQQVANPVPRIAHPDWLSKRLKVRDDRFKQQRLTFGAMGGSSGKGGNDEGVLLDVEEAAGRSGNVTLPNTPTTSPLPAAETQQAPDITKDYPAWLGHYKAKWRRANARRAEMQRLYELDGDARRRAVESARDTGAFVRRQAEAVLLQPWEVLQIVETREPGALEAWVLVEGALHRVGVQVPRTVYVDVAPGVEVPAALGADVQVATVTRLLPRTQIRQTLCELRMPEATFQRLGQGFAQLSQHRGVRGVYETQVPALFRALVHIGAVSGLSRARARELRDSTARSARLAFSLDDVEQVRSASTGQASAATVTYLSDARRALRVVYLYHACGAGASDGSSARELFGLYMPSAGRCAVAIVDPGAQRHVGNLDRLYSERLQTLKSNDEAFFAYPAAIAHDIQVHRHRSGALQTLQRALTNYQSDGHGATLLVLQSPRRLGELAGGAPSLLDLPVVTVPDHKRDLEFPALDWQTWVARRMVQRFFHVDAFLCNRRALARHGQVPLGNVDHDAALFLADVLLARKLGREDALLWYSATAQPDLGMPVWGAAAGVPADELVSPEISVSGAHDGACVEVHVGDLALNALLVSAQLHSDEAGGAAPGESLGQTGTASAATVLAPAAHGHRFDELQVSFAVLSLLRTLVREWHADAVLRGNALADTLLVHFARWATSPVSRLHDPAVYALLHELMKKVFALLVVELRNFGCEIVHASFQRMVVATGRPTVHAGARHVAFALRALQEKPALAYLTLTTGQVWANMLWVEPFNYGGLTLDSADGDAGQDDVASGKRRAGEAGDEPKMVIDAQWNMAEHLPETLQAAFNQLVAEYLLQARNFAADRDAETLRAGAKRARTASGDAGGVAAPAAETAADAVAQQKQHYVQTVLQRKLLKVVADAQRAPPQQSELERPVLEFVKFVCRALGADAALDGQVRVLRRTLLSLLRVGEFSKDARFSAPSDTFRLCGVICTYCNYTRDLDFGRDPDLVSGSAAAWRCPGCRTAHDQRAIEQRLVDICHRRIVAYQTQDVRCSRCRLVRPDTASAVCRGCTAPYTTVSSSRGLLRVLKVFSAISERHGMELLGEVVSWAQS